MEREQTSSDNNTQKGVMSILWPDGKERKCEL